MSEHRDEPLLRRLRDLSLVDVDALLAGTSGERRGALLEAYAEDLHDALETARQRMQELSDSARRGPDPLAPLSAGAIPRGRDAGPGATSRVASRLAARAHAHRLLARFDDLIAQLLPRLFEVDRRR